MAKLHRQKSKTTRQSPVNLTRLSVEDVAKIFKASGYRTCTAAAIAADLAAGAPAEDGKLNFMHYAAWLVKNP